MPRPQVVAADDAAVIARIERSRMRASEAVDSSLNRLDKVVRSKAGAFAAGGMTGPAARALMHVLYAYGIELSAAAMKSDRLLRAGSLAAAAQALGVRTRRIVLPAQWWENDHGHLLGFWRADGEITDADEAPVEEKNASAGAEPARSSERIVALIAVRGKGYRLFDPVTGEEQAVSEDLADRIEDIAFVPYPPLPEKISGLRDLARFIIPLIRGDISAVIAAGALIGLLGAVLPLATALIVDSLIPGSERGLLFQVGMALAAGALLNFVFSIMRQRAMLRINGRSDLILQAAMWDRLLKLPATFFKSYSSGDLGQRVGGIGSLRSAVINVLFSATVTAFFSLFYLVLLFSYDARLAWLGLALISLLGIATFLVGIAQIKYYKRQIEISAWLSGYVFQVLQGIIKLRVANAEDRAFVRWAEKYSDERQAIMTTQRTGNQFGAFAEAYGTLSLAAIFAATFHLSGNTFTAGTFIAFIAAYGSLQGAFQGLSGAALQIVAVMPDWERARPILEAKPESPVRAADPGVLTGDIEITGVTFAYGEAAPVLRDVSITLAAGEQVALVGPSGSGKSTLVRILLGLERAQTGTVLYNGQDLSSLDPTLVRQQIGVVTQAGRLSSGTVMDNIRGASNASYEDCIAAANAAGFESDLAKLPMGLHTPLTDGATTLSGGQRQRILIARALVGRPRILVFDEATSALDNRTQEIVTQSLAALSVTRLVVAHRLSTVRRADRIYVMQDGKVAQSGSYGELIAMDGLFADLARRQLTGKEEE